jgi:hypothetical protein
VGPARAQDPTERVWIQIESYAALGNTEARIRTYTPEFDNVNGFNAGGFYAITLGPYVRAEAQRVLGELLAAGRIPSDSFIQPRQAYSSQFFPIGEDRLDGALAVGAEAAAVPKHRTPPRPKHWAEAEAAEAAAEAEAAAAEAAAAAPKPKPPLPPQKRRPLRPQRPKRQPSPRKPQRKLRPLRPPQPKPRPKPLPPRRPLLPPKSP